MKTKLGINAIATNAAAYWHSFAVKYIQTNLQLIKLNLRYSNLKMQIQLL